MNKKKLLILGGAFVASLAIVFVVLFTTSRVNYSGAVEKSEAILSSKETVSEVLNTKLDDLSKFDAAKLENYSATIKETKEKLGELQSEKACTDTKYKEKCEELGKAFEKLELSSDSTAVIIKFVNESQDIAGVSSDTLNELKNSTNPFLQELGNDLIEYRGLVDSFKEKYVANADDVDFVADYSKIDEKRVELLDKYSKISSEKLFGASNEELLSFYDKIEELKKLFAEEK